MRDVKANASTTVSYWRILGLQPHDSAAMFVVDTNLNENGGESKPQTLLFLTTNMGVVTSRASQQQSYEKD